MKIRYDEHLDSYKGFFDHEWIKELSKKVEFTFLNNIVLELSATWKGASNARYLPWLMVENIKSVLSGYMQVNIPLPLEVINALVDRISKNIEKHSTTLLYTDKQALIKEIQDVQNQVIHTKNKFPEKIDKYKIWKELIEISEFVFSLWMSKVNAYSAIYFAYENFLVRSVKHKLGLEKLWTRNLFNKIETLLGTEVAKMCWTEQPVEKARLIRHALVHNGRKMTNDLEKYRDQLELEDNEIIIFPHYTTNLFNDLKDRVTNYCHKLIGLT